MKFKEFGDKSLPTVIMLHGGGLSWWSLKEIAYKLIDTYHVVTPIIDGHGEDGETAFVSIEDSANKLIEYIDGNFDGQVHALYGLSIGAQIVTEVLSKRAVITKYAIIESALIYPIPGTATITAPTFKLFFPLINKKWFAKIQSKSLFVSDDMFEQYYEDSKKISKDSLINITVSNGTYSLKDSIRNTTAKVLLVVGSKELGIMKKSASTLNKVIANSEMYIAKNMGHGQISLSETGVFIDLLRKFLY